MTKQVAGASSSRRVLELLLSYSETRPRATVAELAEAIGATLATTYRYVALLRELDLLEEAPGRQYQLTPRVMPLARAAQLVNDRARLALPLMEELAEEVRETVMLFELRGDEAVCVQRVECQRPMRFTFMLGHPLPLHGGASSRMLLAALPEKLRKEALATVPAKRRGDLAGEVAAVIERGYAVSRSEVDEGVWACSVPVVSGSPDALVLSIAGPDSRIPGEDPDYYIERATSCAGRVREALGRLRVEADATGPPRTT
ncbi:IclR family transcriptional regulator [Georgenia alba]|uniref:IclR family transcriptional regulator n=1 Tax=Georgenia alba TaxID=2233858 RepID=A0ABW2Q848_9MICO